LKENFGLTEIQPPKNTCQTSRFCFYFPVTVSLYISVIQNLSIKNIFAGKSDCSICYSCYSLDPPLATYRSYDKTIYTILQFGALFGHHKVRITRCKPVVYWSFHDQSISCVLINGKVSLWSAHIFLRVRVSNEYFVLADIKHISNGSIDYSDTKFTIPMQII
jgi:hypothetical protein